MLKNSCEICCEGGTQVKMILFNFKLRLSRVNSQYIPDFKDEVEGLPLSHDGFSRLLTIVFGDNTISALMLQKCSHQKFKRYLRRKLKCDNKKLNDLSNELIEQLARRNYQIQILANQLKGIDKTCLRLSKDPRSAELVLLKHKQIDQLQKVMLQQRITLSQLQEIKNHKNNQILKKQYIENEYSQNPFAHPSIIYFTNSYITPFPGNTEELFRINNTALNPNQLEKDLTKKGDFKNN